MYDFIHSLVVDSSGLEGQPAMFVAAAVSFVAMLALAWLVDQVTKRVLLAGVKAVIRRSGAGWDDVLVEYGIFRRLAHLAPACVIWLLTPLVLPAEAAAIGRLVRGVALVVLIIGATVVLNALISAAREIYRRRQGDSRVPTGGVVQLLKTLLYLLAAILLVSAVSGQTPLYLLSGLGALTAVLIIVFRDPLLGLVGGLHLTTNDMVRVGDWIEMPKYGADGSVADISLTSVKVQNWDKTISTVPTYSLISDSFKNWRGMEESGGRRIKRSIHIDMTSVHFVDAEMLDRLLRVQLLREYIARKRAELAEFNKVNEVDDVSLVNGRRLTNLGILRAYLQAYLKAHPKIHNEMTLLVRQLAPGPEGIPIEIYVFSNDQEWNNYESIQADIFDHLLAVIPEFELRVFQTPSGADFRTISAPSR